MRKIEAAGSELAKGFTLFSCCSTATITAFIESVDIKINTWLPSETKLECPSYMLTSNRSVNVRTDKELEG